MKLALSCGRPSTKGFKNEIFDAAIINPTSFSSSLFCTKVQESTQINPINLLVSVLKITATSFLSHSIDKLSTADQENLNLIASLFLDWTSTRFRSDPRRTFLTICSLVTSKRRRLSCCTI